MKHILNINKILRIFVFFIFLIIGLKGFAQTRQGKIEGVVTDLDGNPLNARIIFGGKNSLASNGVFSFDLIKLPDTLHISLMGFANVTRVIHDTRPLRIRLTPMMEYLEEVLVNTGYQSISPNEINGSIALINEKSLQMRVGGNILDRLVGHSSGILQMVGKDQQEFSSTNGMLVRGLGTINGPKEPLIVLDGFVYEGNINNLNPNDIENVSILKDASAASIWGARAGNGVIVITSKKGRFNEKLRVSFQMDHSLQKPANFDINLGLSAKDEIEIEKFLFDKGHFDNSFNRTPYQQLTPIIEILLQQREGKLTLEEVDELLGFWSKQDVRKNYRDEFYTNAHNQNYNFQISGGSDRNNYILGTSYSRNLSETYAKLDRLNIRLNNQFKISDKMILGINALLSNNQIGEGRPTYGSIKPQGRNGSYLAFRDDNGFPLSLDYQYRGTYTDSIGANKLLDWKFYPAEDYKHKISNHNRLELFSAVNLSYNPIPSLSLTGSYQYQIQNTKRSTHHDINSYYVRNLINQMTQINPTTGVVSYVIPPAGILSSNTASINSFAWRGQANFKEIFNGHMINIMTGFEMRGSGTRSEIAPLKYGYQDDPLVFSQVDLMTRYPHFITGAQVRLGSATNLTRTDYRFASLYGNLAYSYRNRYFLNSSIRRDGSNVFGANTNDRWVPLWSAGLGWDLSNENFYEANYFSKIKIVLTYGVSGNVDMTKTASPIATYNTNTMTGFPYMSVTSINNPDLRWEKQSQFSARFDLIDRNNRITSTLNIFKKYGSDLYGQAPFDFTGWGRSSTLLQNVAKMEGYGVELDFNSINYKTSNLEWMSSFFFNWNENKTKEYYNGTDYSELLMLFIYGTGTKINPVVGKPLYTVTGLKYAGLDNQGNPIGYINETETIDYTGIYDKVMEDGSNIKYFGSGLPRFFGSLSNNIKYNSLTLSVGLRYHFGYYLKKPHMTSLNTIAGGLHKDYSSRWKKPGDELITDIPAFMYPLDSNRDLFYTESEAHVIPGDHIRLDYIRTSYNLNTTQWKFPLRNFEIYLGLENGPLLWRKNKFGLDPNYLKGNQTQIIWSTGFKLQF